MKEPEAEIVLPKQENFFSTDKLRRSARAGTHLPDPTMAPYGYDPKARFNHLFPALELPALFPPGRLHLDDHVSFGLPELPPHQLYLGDNLYVLRGLPSETIDLIYIDPPFFSNRTYTQIWDDDNEVRSFGDIFQDGMFSYLAWLNARLWEMKRVLKPTGTVLAEGKIGLHKWLMAIYLLHTARKGISSVQMAKHLGVTQKTAWFLDHRIREAIQVRGGLFAGPVEVDETFVGGRERNKHAARKLHAGRGAVGKMAVFGIRERGGDVKAFPVGNTDKTTLHASIADNVQPSTTVYSDCHKAYGGLNGCGYDHYTVAHSVGEYVRAQAHTNGIESFWALIKRGYYGIYHNMSEAHLHRYVDEFAHRHNAAKLDTMTCIADAINGMVGRRLSYAELTA